MRSRLSNSRRRLCSDNIIILINIVCVKKMEGVVRWVWVWSPRCDVEEKVVGRCV